MIFATAVTTGQTSTTTIALIALAGAVVGGVLTGGAQLLAERMRSSREQQATSAKVRGVGRVVQYYFSIWQTILDISLRQEKWWRADLEPSPLWNDSDLQLLATAVDDTQWRHIRTGLMLTRSVSTMRQAAATDSDLTLTAMFEEANGFKDQFEQTARAVDEASVALDNEFV